MLLNEQVGYFYAYAQSIVRQERLNSLNRIKNPIE